jgi:hypothetical protein
MNAQLALQIINQLVNKLALTQAEAFAYNAAIACLAEAMKPKEEKKP